jgi:NADH-quinone oxidoreductase subunit N
MMFMVKAADLVMVFIGIETLVIRLCLSVAGRPSFRQAALKYILGAFATAFLLYGIALIFSVTGSTNLSAIAAAIAAKGILGDPAPVRYGFILIGFAFKVSLVPFHMDPDVYERRPYRYLL